jgi:hypothetical protein
MKRGTTEHPKMKRLAKSLRVNRAWAVGILESLWHWAGRFAPQGDIGRFTDDDIAEAVYWPKEPGVLIESLVESGWVDRDAAHRLLIHGWEEHAEESVRKYLKRNSLPFVKVGSFVETFSGHVETSADKVSLPEPEPEPIPKPKPLPKPPDEESVSECLSESWRLPECQKAFDRWFAYLSKMGKQPFDADLAMVSLSQLFASPEEFRKASLAAMANGWGSVNPSMVSRHGQPADSSSVITAADMPTEEDIQRAMAR